MANRYAVATGVWSNPAIWNGGTLPGVGDDVRPNGFTVTIDQDINVNELRHDALAPAVANGYFRLTEAATPAPGITLDCDITFYTGAAQTYVLLIGESISKPITITGNLSHFGNLANSSTVYQGTNTHLFHSLTINGNLLMDPSGSVSSYDVCILAGIFPNITINGNLEIRSTGSRVFHRARGSNADTRLQTLTVNGDIICSGTTSGYGIYTPVTSTVTVQAINVVGDVINSSSATCYCIYTTHDSPLSAVTITGDVIYSGIGAGTCVGSFVYSSYQGRPLTINGDIICTNAYPVGAGGAPSYAVAHHTDGNCYVSGDITAAEGKVALYVSRGRTMVGGDLTAGPNGFMPVVAVNFRTPNAGRTIWTLPEDDSGWPSDPATTPLVLSNYFPETPPEADVREGLTYGVGGSLTGTLAVPADGSVALGVPVDDSEGTAVLLIDSGISTIDSTGAQIAAALTT